MNRNKHIVCKYIDHFKMNWNKEIICKYIDNLNCPLTISRGRNKPKLPLVRRISDMLKTTCPHTCSLVQVLVHFVGPKLDALDRQNRKHESHRFFKFLIWSV